MIDFRTSIPAASYLGDSGFREVRTPRRSEAANGSAQPLLTVAEAANYAHVCKETIYRAARSGALTACKAGRALRIDPRDLRTWLSRSDSRIECGGQVRRLPVRRQRAPMADAMSRLAPRRKIGGRR